MSASASAGHLRSGLLLIDKDKGPTSHDVVAAVRRILGQREVGHTGTLDPLASGLLVLTLGRATRLGRFIESSEKTYEATVRLGRSTTTLDAEGETVLEASLDGLDADQIAQAAQTLVGEIEQEVPAFSAVKVDGERLYARARRGEAVELPKRTVTIRSLEVLRVALPTVDIRVTVSKGTYIRALAAQLGDLLGVPAHLGELRRTAVGRFQVEAAERVPDLQKASAKVIAMTDALPHLRSIALDPIALDHVRHGRPLLVRHLMAARAEGTWKRGDVLSLNAAGDLAAVAVAELDAEALDDADPDARAIAYACVFASQDSGARPE